MLNFQQFQESFDTKPLKWRMFRNESDGTDTAYLFSIAENEYIVAISKDDPFDIDAPVDVSFGIKNAKTNGFLDFNMTNTGNQFQVFVTVIDCMKDYIKIHDPNALHFSAIKNNQYFSSASNARGSLYKRLVKKYLPSGWKADFSEDHDEYVFDLTKT